jgi:ketosteroid isomerase-like protein
MLRSRALLASFTVVVVSAAAPACATSKCAPYPGVTPAPDAGATASTTQDTENMARASATLDRFHAAAAAADEATYFGFFSEGGVFLGTDGKERWTVPELRAYAHPRFASGKAWSFRSTRRDLTVRGDLAWFDEDLDTANLGPARGSGVLVREKESDGWKVAQYNLSIPIPNERFADVRKVIAGGGH